jgi:hypothetical protein
MGKLAAPALIVKMSGVEAGRVAACAG